MNDAVSGTLPLRQLPDDRFGPWVVCSSIAHGALIALIVLIPGVFGIRVSDEPRTVMTISLGGAPGPRAGGMTPMGGRPVQQAVPEEPKARPQAVRPPAAREPEMTVPTSQVRTRPPRERIQSAPDDARGSTPTRGPRERLGSTIAETGGQGVSLGLSTGGGGTGGEINLGDFCCPEYLSTMLQLIQRNWNEKQQVAGTTTMRFTIRRDGTVADIEVARSSGYTALDLAAHRALGLTRLPPLPAAYTNPQLTISLHFQYQR
jgi:TonB family protein